MEPSTVVVRHVAPRRVGDPSPAPRIPRPVAVIVRTPIVDDGRGLPIPGVVLGDPTSLAVEIVHAFIATSDLRRRLRVVPHVVFTLRVPAIESVALRRVPLSALGERLAAGVAVTARER